MLLNELKQFSHLSWWTKRVLAVSKCDMRDELMDEMREKPSAEGVPTVFISAVSQHGPYKQELKRTSPSAINDRSNRW